jgi:hypothetical protein
MNKRDQLTLVRGILYSIGVGVIIIVTLWRLIPR